MKKNESTNEPILIHRPEREMKQIKENFKSIADSLNNISKEYDDLKIQKRQLGSVPDIIKLAMTSNLDSYLRAAVDLKGTIFSDAKIPLNESQVREMVQLPNISLLERYNKVFAEKLFKIRSRQLPYPLSFPYNSYLSPEFYQLVDQKIIINESAVMQAIEKEIVVYATGVGRRFYLALKEIESVVNAEIIPVMNASSQDGEKLRFFDFNALNNFFQRDESGPEIRIDWRQFAQK